MITYGLQAPPSLSALMAFTDTELAKLKAAKLRKGCRVQGSKFVCEYREKGNDIYIGTFDTVKECNEAWDKEFKRRVALKKRKPAGKGYEALRLDDGTYVYKATVCLDQVVYYLGRYDTAEEARAAYVKSIDKINEGLFHEYHKSLGFSQNIIQKRK